MDIQLYLSHLPILCLRNKVSDVCRSKTYTISHATTLGANVILCHVLQNTLDLLFSDLTIEVWYRDTNARLYAWWCVKHTVHIHGSIHVALSLLGTLSFHTHDYMVKAYNGLYLRLPSLCKYLRIQMLLI